MVRRYVYRFISACILTLIATNTFGYVWYAFVEKNNQTGSLMGYGNLLMALSIYAILYIITSKWIGAFKIGVERISKNLASVVLALFATDFIEILVSMAITGQFRFIFRFMWRYLLLFCVQSVILTVVTLFLIILYRSCVPPLQMLEIVGEYENNLTRKINIIKYKYHIAKTISVSEDTDKIFAEIENAEAVIINDIPNDKENAFVKKCFELDKRVYIVPKVSDIIIKSSDNLNVVDTPLFLCRNMEMTPWQKFFKRTMDIILCGLALVVLSPVLLITALAIKLEDHGPVFFRQERVTLNNKTFMILKFRSMIVDAEKDGRPHPAGEKDDRITKVGRIIRTCRIDELPQLINILKGDMSIVGPRPERVEHVETYSKEIPEFNFRHKVKGGLTGYAQVYGKYNTTALDKLKLDLIYIANYRLLLDFQIIFETVKILFQKESTEGFDEKGISHMHDGNS